ncbi:hypothetical protein CH251_10470 [Rhodococcus sp. 06-462-5]|uniref:hypothetical protein n=1 Tax=unclassified Rhodococcus (in: high G+C Gram-positive bacteria) TaxID=192944 RepID=UPI000B9A98DE|nr:MULTISPECIES: hypothetical protein [unclassified Rhodococcus (in: high G+C Gram-positive bacteria)]OZC75192.1 hypothetical protein CH251_10470 [Rhodococcus sp. 06-462-5]OZE67709.1 hypothetical protein CH270_08065 [Rhodococcus sp. 02-925g]
MTPRRVAAAVVVAVTLLAAAGCSTPDTYRPVTAATTNSVAQQPLSSRLAAANDPVDMLLVGDGTGISLGGWVFLTMQGLAQEYGRPAVIHEWNFAAGAGYLEPPISVADGVGTPISLWNASVSRNVGFLTSALPQIRPPSNIDVVLVNNGLDMGPRTLAVESVPLLRTLAETYPQAAVVAILQPSPKEPEDIGDQVRANVHDLEISARKNDFQIIDAAATVNGAEGTYDGANRYPNSEGSRLWAVAVADALIDAVGVPAP